MQIFQRPIDLNMDKMSEVIVNNQTANLRILKKY